MTDHDLTMAFGLTRGMARTLGINLVAAVQEGWYTRSDLAHLVETCEACGLSEHCAAWLAVTPTAARLPAYCRNRTELEALKA